jgi:hypothetical protein
MLNAVWNDNFDGWGFEVQEIRAVGTRVLALVEMTGRTKDSGVATHQPIGIVNSDFRDGPAGY